jgi:hypothetical protein
MWPIQDKKQQKDFYQVRRRQGGWLRGERAAVLQKAADAQHGRQKSSLNLTHPPTPMLTPNAADRRLAARAQGGRHAGRRVGDDDLVAARG